MKLNTLPINWFDLFLLLWLVIGVLRGRKLGLSSELLTFLQWATIVIVSAVAYQPIGDLLGQSSKVISRLWTYVIGYLLAAALVTLAFGLIKRVFGGKLIGSDTFGSWEYYLGMPAGMLRFLCMLLTALALLNARLYTPQEIQADKKYQLKNFDSDFFSGLKLYTIQAEVFQNSFLGRSIKGYLPFLLIRPTGQGVDSQIRLKEWQLK